MRYPLVDGQGNFGSVDGDSAGGHALHRGALQPASPWRCCATSTTTPSTSCPTTTRRGRSRWSCPAASPTCWSTAPPASPWAWPPTSRRTTWARSSTPLVHLIDNPEADRRRPHAVHPGPGLPHRRHHPAAPAAFKEAYRTGRGRVRVRAKAHIEQLKGNRTRDRRHRDALPGQPRRADREDRRAGQDQEDHRDQRPARRVGPRGHAPGHRAQARGRRRRSCSTSSTSTPRCRRPSGSSTSRWSTACRARSPCRRCSRRTSPTREIVIRRTKFELDKAETRAHILEGLLIALDNLDEIISIIRQRAGRRRRRATR